MAISATLIDGLVLARAHMHNSVNYRSVVIFADTVHVITDKEEKDKGLRIITEHVLKGRWDDPDARNPNKAERDSTAVVKIKLSECSAKIRTWWCFSCDGSATVGCVMLKRADLHLPSGRPE